MLHQKYILEAKAESKGEKQFWINLLNGILLLLPHPALFKGKGSKKGQGQVLSFGEDLGEALIQTGLSFLKSLLY
jgi:hypothetical protein